MSDYAWVYSMSFATHCAYPDFTLDIRHPYDDPTPPDYFIDFLNLASTQQALGVNINYTDASSDSVYRGFASTGRIPS